MNPRFPILALLLLGVLLSTPRLGQTADTNDLQEQLQYNFRYSCNGDTIVVIRCRHQSDTPDFAPTRPEKDFCFLIFPDRPKENGMQVSTTELYADVVKRIQACSNSNTPSTTSPRSNAPSATTTKSTAPSGATASDYIDQGDTYRKAKRYSEAIEAFKKSISISPSIGAYSRLGLVYMEDLKQYPEAVAAFESGLRLKPDSAVQRYNLADAFYHMQQYEKALIALQEALRLKPAFGDAKNLMGLIYDDLDKYVEAVAAHKEAVQLEPNNAAFIDNLALIYLNLGRKEDALEACKLLQKINPAKGKERYEDINLSFATPDNDLGNLDLGISIYEEFGARGYGNALRALRRVVLLKSGPDTLGRAHYVIGEIYRDHEKPNLATGEFEQAAIAYQQAIRLEPREGSYYYWLGMADARLGRKPDALRVYKILQTIDPAKAKELYAEINKQ
jgi:tetratricopeptide (TPR) repeat protein